MMQRLRLHPLLLIVAIGAPVAGGCGAPGEAADPAARYPASAVLVDAGDGTVIDPAVGLMWTRAVSEQRMDWSRAREWSEALELAGRDDWRLPTSAELQRLYEALGTAEDQYERRVGPIEWSDAYTVWSSSRYRSYTSVIETVYFHSGFVFYHGKREPLRALAVRSVEGGP